ncbi:MULTISPECIES: shikimate kinase [unclassified Clostridium]|uniref:shikimate kinase n=1 Tax=unclassified Clostridium TaxID=2614128 RepID=UPI0002973271|nr:MULTISPECIES: shikimate kinase [unclassified Clostridium]EKQ56469.1 MAG: shikimate kinase [Clostridium sp. Maddingley MBC34-26]
MKNKVVFIGMPGCGKSTIGRLVSKELNIKFIDMDKYIEDMTSKTIPELFEQGEDYFRDFESLACKELSKENNIIISSGGGVVKRKENIDALRENSFIIFIDRPLENLLEDIDVSKRPLLKDGREKLVRLYEERYELYRLAADEIIKNDEGLNGAINKVKEVITSNININ